MTDELTNDQVSDLRSMTATLDGWQGLMAKESVAATVYTFTMIHFTKSLFHAFVSEEIQRDALI